MRHPACRASGFHFLAGTTFLASLGRYLLISAAITAVLIAVIAAAYLFGYAGGAGGNELARAKSSERGLFSVSMKPETGAVHIGETQAWLVTIRMKSGQPVENAAIHVSGGMAEQNQGLPTSPQATDYLGGGSYRIQGVKFPTPGWWQLRLWIFAAAGTDSVIFNVVL
jgi:hypothetical protein